MLMDRLFGRPFVDVGPYSIFVISDWRSNLSSQKRPNITNEEAQNEAERSKRNADIVWPLVGQRKRLLRTRNNDWVSVSSQHSRARRQNLLDFVESCVANEFRDMRNCPKALRRGRIDDELCSQGFLSNDFCQVLGDFAEEEVRIHCETNSTTNVSDAESDSSDGCNKFVGAGDLRNDGGWDDDTANTNRGECNNSVDGVQVVWCGYSYRTGTGCHQSGEENHERANAAFRNWDKKEADDCTADDTKADG
jgi:hypothetical protein